MKKAISAALSLVALASTVLIQPQPASAQNDIERFLRRYVGGGSGFNGNFNGGLNQVQIQTNVQTGIANLQTQLQTGVNAGTISASEAAAINAEIARVTSMHNSFLFNGYTNDEVNQILSSFTQLNSMVASATTGGSVIGTVPYPNNYGTPFFGDYNSVINLQSSVTARINNGVANGSLTRAEANQLRSELNQISRQINRRQVAGNLNTNPVVRRLSNLDRRVNQMINDNAYAGGNWWY